MTISSSVPDNHQAVQPRETTCYNSKYLAEYYDIYIGTWNDIQLYDKVLNNTIASQPAEAVTVLDIGTGTGRIIHALAASPKRAPVHFLGLDIEPRMLERAQQLSDRSTIRQNNIDWILGSADDLEALPVFQRGPFVDMLIFGCGGICHLHRPGQGERCFQQIAKVLKPKTGRAYISVARILSDGGEAELLALQPPFGANAVPSKEFPGIIYRETWPRHEVVDKMCYTTRHIVVSQVLTDGSERVVEHNLEAREARIWTEADMRTMAKAAGLQVVDIIAQRNEEALDERIYVLAIDA
ncbi:hypothetical protein AbraIFM66951_002295 [Aspergillus brasiliensis]|uniref:Methyltransferase domain-containing protein n=1 Tax=Aspergillus brasiliensis TaxID=319629 RepID=A0A9W6DQY6_9EURO|nr:hypothetical protein AbraCBS73388_011050 [Aspergillus brasiliensis]GKZ42604.1 hypothetical protein AbraIFM66951_002295 [Aspergillus brasiliensis]